METAVHPGHFVYLAGWDTFDDFNLKFDDSGDERRHRRGKKGTTLRELLQGASERGAMIRALFWFGYWAERKFGIDNYPENKKAANAINVLRNGHAIMDGRIQFMGSHHQKLLLVYGSEGLIAFAGGRDFHPGRIFASGEDRSDLDPSGGKLEGPELPYLDLHVQIRGHAAYDLLEIFLRRYADHPTAGAEGHEIIALRPKPGPASAAVDPHPITVRVCTTNQT